MIVDVLCEKNRNFGLEIVQRMKEIRFIVNPISGGKDKKRVVAAIEKHLDGRLYHPEFLFTEKATMCVIGFMAKIIVRRLI